MKQLDCDSYEFCEDGVYYGLVCRTEKNQWVADIWVGPATINMSKAQDTPELAKEKALMLLDKLYCRIGAEVK
jgi:hypothetical protein